MRRTRPVVNKTTADHPSPVGGAFSQHMAARRFPPPWSVEELDTCFVVRDHNGQQLAYVYFEGHRTVSMRVPWVVTNAGVSLADKSNRLPRLTIHSVPFDWKWFFGAVANVTERGRPCRRADACILDM